MRIILGNCRSRNILFVLLYFPQNWPPLWLLIFSRTFETHFRLGRPPKVWPKMNIRHLHVEGRWNWSRWDLHPAKMGTLQTGDIKRRPGNRIEGATGCPSWCRPLRPLFHFLDDVSYPQSVHGDLCYSHMSALGSAPPVVKIKTSIMYPTWKLIFLPISHWLADEKTYLINPILRRDTR